MAAVKAFNTSPEVYVRRILFSEGFRFRLNKKNLPGKPDVVLAKYKTVVFIHGCFWHRHICQLTRMPKSNTDYWIKKFNSNINRDKENIESLLAMKWKVVIVWECAIKRKLKLPEEVLRGKLSSAIRDNSIRLIEIEGCETELIGK